MARRLALLPAPAYPFTSAQKIKPTQYGMEVPRPPLPHALTYRSTHNTLFIKTHLTRGGGCPPARHQTTHVIVRVNLLVDGGSSPAPPPPLPSTKSTPSFRQAHAAFTGLQADLMRDEGYPPLLSPLRVQHPQNPHPFSACAGSNGRADVCVLPHILCHQDAGIVPCAPAASRQSLNHPPPPPASRNMPPTTHPARVPPPRSQTRTNAARKIKPFPVRALASGVKSQRKHVLPE